MLMDLYSLCANMKFIMTFTIAVQAVSSHFKKVIIMAKIRESAEDYLETILILKKRNGLVRSIDIATEMEFSKPSVSVAMKNLREKGCIEVDGKGYISLTPYGLSIAEKIYERHQFLSAWFIELGVDPKTAVDDACRMEHIISADTFEAIKRHVLHLRNIKDE